MLTKIIKKGLMFGLIMGLVVSSFDSLLMLTPNVNIPYSHPWFVLIFNLCFWMTFGCILALFLWLPCFYKKSTAQLDNFSQACFFLIPFSFTYGFLGCLKLRDNLWVPGKPFDYYASFVWVTGFFLFLFLFKKRVNKKKSLPISYLPELFAVTGLFQFCFNLEQILMRVNPFEDIKLHLSNRYIFLIYAIGVLCILGAYLLSFCKLNISIKASKKVLAGLVLTVVLLLNGFLVVNQINIRGGEFRSKEAIKSTPVKVPFVILIVLDTVRANRLSVYAPLGTTKNLELFSRDAVVYENCFSPSSWTLPSHASLFTGLYPVEHGALYPPTHEKYLSCTNYRNFTTLADIFKDNNYSTIGVISNAQVVNSFNNMDKGFQTFDCLQGLKSMNRWFFKPIYNIFIKMTHINSAYLKPYRPAEQINKNVIKNLKESPFFIFVNYMDAHKPNYPPWPFNNYFTDLKFSHLFKIKQYLGCTFSDCPDDESIKLFERFQYDREIAYLDHHLGKLFNELKVRGLYDSALIVVTSDHGEFIGEHEQSGHTGDIALYNEVVKIPLIIKFPNNAKNGREHKLITLPDVFSTILSICNISAPNDISGRTFRDESTPVVSELETNTYGRQRIICLDRYKYIEFEKNHIPELYDFKADPDETTNLAVNLPEITASMKKQLASWCSEHKPKYKIIASGKKEMSPEILADLKTLGYVQ